MSRPRLELVHSPLTGPSFWAGVHDTLWAGGWRAHLARLPAPEYVHPPYWLTHAAGVAAGLAEDEPVVLVAHSGAGPLLPAIGRLARNREHPPTIAGYVFVDCDLPRDGCSRLDLFDDPDAADALRRHSTGGWIPQPTFEQLRTLLPDEHRRAAFVAELPRVPLAMYEEIISVPDDWPEVPCGYLSLSEHYPSSVERARRLGWTNHRLSGGHLAPTAIPAAVAAVLTDLVSRLAR